MYDIFQVFTAVLLVGIAVSIALAIKSAANSLEFYHLISTEAKDGSYYVDWNRIGQGAGVILCSVIPFIYVYSPKMDATGLAAILGVALAYLGGVSGYAATLRSKQGQVETVRTSEDSSRVTETKTETPPLSAKGKPK